MKTSTGRNTNFDLLRILACLFVICCHVASIEIHSVSVFTEKWISAHVFNGIGHTGSIIFLFLSGSLLLSDDYDFQPKKFYLNNFLKLLVCYQLWVTLYNVIGVIQRGNYGPEYLKDILINSIAGNACYHFWYLPTLLGIYLILPMLRAICKMGKWVPVYFVSLFLVIQILFKTILFFDFKYKYLVAFLFNRIPVTLVNHYVGYFMMGYLLTWIIKEKKIKKPFFYGILLFVSGIVIGLIADLYLSVKAGGPKTTFNDIFTISSCISAVGMFLLMNAKHVKINEKGQKIILVLSKLTFGIYMVHPMFIDIIKEFWQYLDFLPRMMLIPVMVMVLFIISAVLIWILSRIPVVDEWLLFCGKRKKDTA